MSRTALARLALAALAALPVLGSPLPASAAEEAVDYAALLEQKAPAVVSVKFVLKMRMEMGGQTQDQEQNGEVRGVVVDPAGLVMLSNDALEGPAAMLRQMMRRRGAGGAHGVTATPTDIKVLFGNESKEHDAVLVARDSNLGVAFVQILSLEGRVPAVADLTKAAEPKVGQTLVTVTRKSRGFDCAPFVGRLFVTGHVEKPRAMWSVDVTGPAGLPVFDGQGRVAGVLVRQDGSAGVEDGGMFGAEQGIFLLPLDAVQRVLEQAKKRVPEAVAKAKEAAAEAAPSTPAPAAPEAPKAPETPK